MFLKWWFVVSAVGLAALYFLVDRRNRTISQLTDEAQKQLLAQTLVKLRDKAEGSGHEFKSAMEEYDNLKLRHGKLLQSWGVFTGNPKPTPLDQYTKPNGRRDDGSDGTD